MCVPEGGERREQWTMDRGWWTTDSASRSPFLFRMLFAPSGDETWMCCLPRVTLRSPAAKYGWPAPRTSCCGFGGCLLRLRGCLLRLRGCLLRLRGMSAAVAMGVPFLLLVYRCLYLRKCDSRLVGTSLLTSGWPLRVLPWCIERGGPRKQAGYLTKLPL